ncbi:RNA-guided endonuclease InsQ/TnpB family protein [Nostoc parmelioides]|uniref:IS200/IS605 family element transposase accessory protein TnpB n=1 Tax=Nostoc parmelioides FACHB-3921 TaxID=2692909 RepID=A0ABR8BHF2_9NOSO|nr:RNA-guided endonuclease TnpB family protein [Nostoc parmelioides]MBD2253543.1 IS200/IS605 family element transposase accessory protein TnpB [Nostoc parmelioides FACHB-3921]
MLLGFKTELKLNNKQRTQLSRHCGVARHAWNWGLSLTKQILDHNKINPEEKIKFPSAIDLHKWLVAMVKPEHPWYFYVSKCAPQYALRDLRTAWDRCFKKVSGVPKFKKKGKFDSFELDGTIKIRGTRKIQLPRLGALKTYEDLPQVQPKSVTISRTADRWYISFRIEVEPRDTPKTIDVVGVDLGVKSLATLSTGEVLEGAKSYRKLEAKLSRLQWLNRHKQRGSANWRKAQIKIAKLHQRIANIRKDTLHKLTTYLAKNHGVIVIEDLNVSGMMANRKLAKAIADMGFYEFRRQLEYKTQLYGSELVVVDRFYPSSKTCSNCGTKKESLLLSERVFKCENCGFECDRDLNAAINLSHCVALVPKVVASGVSKAVSHAVPACGVDNADVATVKQEDFSLLANVSKL